MTECLSHDSAYITTIKKGLERLPTNQRATKGLMLRSKDGGESFIGWASNKEASGVARHFLLTQQLHRGSAA